MMLSPAEFVAKYGPNGSPHFRTYEKYVTFIGKTRAYRATNLEEIKQKAREYARAPETKTAAAKRYQDNKDHYSAKNRAYYQSLNENELKARNEKQRWNLFKRLYGIGQKEYETLLTEQGNGCGICGRAEHMVKNRKGALVPRRLAVDHCHDTGRVRGLLCTHCNTALGKFGDSEAGLLKALEYIRGRN